MKTIPYLSHIFIYPIKSLAGIEVKQWEVAPAGFKYDRKWMLVDAQGNFLSQRNLPRMALIQTQIIDQQLVVSASGQEDLPINLQMPAGKTDHKVTIWNDQCTAQEVSQEASLWFSDVLQMSCSLVYQPEANIRSVDQKYAQATDQTSFSDGFPFLITSEASLALLNKQMDLALSMRRFRPNLVIKDCASYAEDYWRKISIGNISFRLPKPCARCAIPQINPDTALSDKEPLRTLAKTRKWNNEVFFGQNALHDNQGLLKVGDTVTIEKTGDAQPPLANVTVD
ncbi:MAG: MOSC domain-containing protein [Gammaproteobacteria bacterium]|jgi:uncharacterized protein|nr:MOSC domain-containing protein [Gammaproteobacteria bacterium]MBT5222335.1 MOSC domain-containing protein [Gammaproteobacteria bacterium]MBT5825795.1 MOSC domain-containing protein [Gammaproteobacteria bacterium]MBT6421180.1 MOSC domain-containing protein [Gammaproteobacteria bacterium]MBT6576796.1 MOSC domain-containing protein [Gammaproteobacteria bacterium]